MRFGNFSGLLRFLYNHNPFHLISAALFVYSLKRPFRSGNNAILFSGDTVDYIEPWGLIFSLVGVTVLMGGRPLPCPDCVADAVVRVSEH